MNLSKIWITKRVFKILPMTKEQAYDFLRTFFRMEVESKWSEYKETESIKESLMKVAGFLAGETHKRGLFLCGHVGNGKTTLLTCISKLYGYLTSEGYIEYNESTRGFESISAQELALSVIDDKELYDKCKRCDKLIIDDVGEDATEIPVYGVNRNPVKDVIMYRYEHRLLTIISSNLNAKLIKEKYHDERLSDRIREMYEIVVFKDNSFRR